MAANTDLWLITWIDKQNKKHKSSLSAPTAEEVVARYRQWNPDAIILMVEKI